MHTGSALTALVLLSGLTGAVAGSGHHHGHAGPEAGRAETPATQAFRAADAEMHRDMAITYTGDVDIDFLRGMIPHHRGALAMARIALVHSRDPDVRRLAQDIVEAQDREIAQMQALLTRLRTPSDR